MDQFKEIKMRILELANPTWWISKRDSQQLGFGIESSSQEAQVDQSNDEPGSSDGSGDNGEENNNNRDLIKLWDGYFWPDWGNIIPTVQLIMYGQTINDYNIVALG